MPAKSRVVDLDARGAHGAAPTGEWANFGEYAMAVRATRWGRPDSRLTRSAGLSSTIGSDGGFAIPEQFIADLQMRVYGQSIAGYCSVVPMTSNSASMPAIDETDRRDGSRWGGVLGYWLDEGVAPTATKPKFASIGLNTKKIEVLAHTTDEMMQDVPTLGASLKRILTAETAFQLDRAIIAGTAGQVQGILNSNAKIKVAKEVSQSAATITAENLITMYSRMWGASRKSAVWLVSEDVDAYLVRTYVPAKNLAATDVVSGAPLYVPAVGGEDYARLLGRPVIITEACNLLGQEGDVIFASLDQFQIGDRGLRFNSSIHVNFGTDQTVFRLISRCDGAPLWKAPVTPRNGGPTLSPFITLADRS